jgi:hypothetical protein
MYPYKLGQNPYPSSATPTSDDTRVLGGSKHKDGKFAVVSCINELSLKLSDNPSEKNFRLITVIQDVGSGKTHLAFHIRGLQLLSKDTAISYIDLAQIAPRSIESICSSILRGFSESHLHEFKKEIIFHLKNKAKRDSKGVKKIFGYGLLDSIAGKKLDEKIEKCLTDPTFHTEPNALERVLSNDFSPSESRILKLIVEGRLKEGIGQNKTLEETIEYLAAIARLNHRFMKKLTLLEIDELDSDQEAMTLVKAIINAHLPSTLLMLILTPNSYEKIRNTNNSVFDRLEKANYKIDLAGSNSPEEILDIVSEYIKYYDIGKNFSPKEENELAAKVRVIYDEFPDFRNVRSMINILYHAAENAAARNIFTIDEQAFEETIKEIYPGLRIKGSIMSVPVSEFIKIQKNCKDLQNLEDNIKAAVRALVDHASITGRVTTLAGEQKYPELDIVYNDSYGTRTAVSVVLNSSKAKSPTLISKPVKSSIVDKLIILTDREIVQEKSSITRSAVAGSISAQETVINIDRSRMADLIYFGDKYKNNQIDGEDLERALALAKSIRIC